MWKEMVALYFLVYLELLLYTATRWTKKSQFTNLDFREELLKDLNGRFSKKLYSVVNNMLPLCVADENCLGERPLTRNFPKVVYGCAVCLVHLCKERHVPYHEAVGAQKTAPAWP
ncbi:hypothetical protein MAR_019937 [Mya arenaria]|uniref:Uncharacterized protein n=1 Tax=Mya arenaria TaxID=6604 RepID=A0ABY7E712_MYAAR|nr:hypothetical protein MAR_019937 [Mya arenaria]